MTHLGCNTPIHPFYSSARCYSVDSELGDKR